MTPVALALLILGAYLMGAALATMALTWRYWLGLEGEDMPPGASVGLALWAGFWGLVAAIAAAWAVQRGLM